MRKNIQAFAIRAFASLIAFSGLMSFGSPAWALNFESWVSETGADANSCALTTAPCRTIGEALGKTQSGGTIHVLSGLYDPFIVNKSIEIIADGTSASIAGAGLGNGFAPPAGIFVNAGASDVVRIRGLMVNQLEGGIVGLTFVSGAALHLDRCTFVDLVVLQQRSSSRPVRRRAPERRPRSPYATALLPTTSGAM